MKKTSTKTTTTKPKQQRRVTHCNDTRWVPFKVAIPPLKPGQAVLFKEIHVPVDVEDGVELMTREAHKLIDRVKLHGMVSRLYETVRELTGASIVETNSKPQATPQAHSRPTTLQELRERVETALEQTKLIGEALRAGRRLKSGTGPRAKESFNEAAQQEGPKQARTRLP